MIRSVVALVLVVLTGCSTGLRAPAAPEVADAADVEEAAPVATPAPASPPAGTVTVVQPNPVGTWWQRSPEDLGAGDLAALWSLPLYRTDPLGRRAPGLAIDARVVTDGATWSVEVDLAPGTWSDGEAVTAEDVVATAEVLAAARPAAWGAWTGAAAVDEDTVQLTFDRPFAGWADLLSAAPGVLPAHVLAEGGLEAYDEALPVTGGWFELAGRRAGISMQFTAHEGSPLGVPGVAAIEVLVVPGTDTALGLLAQGRADLSLGHVVIDPEVTLQEVDGLVGESTFGGTRFELVWPDGAGTGDQRLAAASRLDPAPFVDGLLREVGRLPGGLFPAHERLAVPAAADADGSVSVLVPRTVEGLGLLARRLQADLQNAGAAVSLVRLDPPEHLAPPVAVDAHLRVVRVAPQRSVAAVLDEVGMDSAAGLAVDAVDAGPVDPLAVGVVPPPDLDPVLGMLVDDPRLLPIAEVAVTHVWHPDRIEGVAPSAWPGIGLWNAGEWQVPTG